MGGSTEAYNQTESCAFYKAGPQVDSDEEILEPRALQNDDATSNLGKPVSPRESSDTALRGSVVPPDGGVTGKTEEAERPRILERKRQM